MQKLISIVELEYNELVELFENNEELRREVEHSYIDIEMEWLGDITQDFYGIKDYSVGFYNHNYIDIDIFNIHMGIKTVQEYYGFFSEEDYKQLEKLMDLSTIEDEQEDEQLEEREENIKDIILEQFNLITEIKKEYLLDYFTDSYIENLENYFIKKDKKDYRIFKKTIEILK